ncbi:hypothetical protein [Aliarcobacter skirrowii]|uniref:Uncharacterized protein n=1 Tax=Aliarcobacter skirrowii TaxID=28200 RepID=A0AAW9DAF6_9BACT|nr:hypothetical protein [Aliarcobacter skirrowii]MDX4069153.1 hypothetical protein [Aliarcobacter skirrowii]
MAIRIFNEKRKYIGIMVAHTLKDLAYISKSYKYWEFVSEDYG